MLGSTAHEASGEGSGTACHQQQQPETGLRTGPLHTRHSCARQVLAGRVAQRPGRCSWDEARTCRGRDSFLGACPESEDLCPPRPVQAGASAAAGSSAPNLGRTQTAPSWPVDGQLWPHVGDPSQQ